MGLVVSEAGGGAGCEPECVGGVGGEESEQAAAVFQNVETVQEHSVAVARAETGDRVFQEIGCLVTGKEAECGADYGKQTFPPA